MSEALLQTKTKLPWQASEAKNIPKDFDCLAFKAQAQAQIYEKIKDMTPEEEIAYFRNSAKTGKLRHFWQKIELNRLYQLYRKGEIGMKTIADQMELTLPQLKELCYESGFEVEEVRQHLKSRIPNINPV